MKRLFDCADRYIQSRDWKMLAFLKFCLCAVGILLGLSVSPKHKKCAAAGAFGVFLLFDLSIGLVRFDQLHKGVRLLVVHDYLVVSQVQQ